MKGKVFLTVALILASLLLVMPLIGCSFTTASLSEATMCTGVDENEQPLDSTDVFSFDTPEIFCSVKLSNAPSETVVKAEWVYVEGEAGVTDYLLGEYELPADGTRYLGFSFSPDGNWPRGDYKVVLYVDGKEKLSVPFTVE
ncbi:MAG TPA: hypothetical protein VMW60_03715 [Dehalococcoidales bacterium]|nr:hypothetical protein [Dehalococcoidales bacterium]